MDAKSGRDSSQPRHQTTTERTSDRELVVTRTFNAPARLLFDAWTKPELLQKWWIPKSVPIHFVSCEAEVRTGGTYRFVFGHADAPQPMAFFGRYIEVIQHKRLVWTNEESGENGSITTVTFDEKNGQTTVVVHDLYPSKEALDEAISSGSTAGYVEQYEQLDAALVTMAA